MPSVAKPSVASAKQAVVVNVHYAPPKRQARKRATRRARAPEGKGQMQGPTNASSFSMPSQHTGQFYVTPPIPTMPRLVPESIGLGALSSPYDFSRKVAPSPLTTTSSSTPASAPVKEEGSQTPPIDVVPRRGAVIPIPFKLEMLGHEHVKPETLTSTYVPPRERDYVNLGEKKPLNPAPTRGEEVLAHESIKHEPPTVDEHAPQSVGSLRARFAPEPIAQEDPLFVAPPPQEETPSLGPWANTRGASAAANSEGLPDRQYKGPKAQERLLIDLPDMTARERRRWFGTVNGGNFLRRALATLGQGGDSKSAPLSIQLAQDILEAHALMGEETE